MSFTLKSLMVDTKSAWVDYPGAEGFSVEVANLGRERLVRLRKECMMQRFDRKLKMSIEELDEKKFVREFTRETVKGWKGLKLRYLETLMLVELGNQDLDAELEYTEEDAALLVSNSTDFDNWLNQVVFDLENFRSKRKDDTVGSTGEVSE